MQVQLAHQVEKWPTPFGFQAGNGPDGNEFSTAVRKWQTPKASELERGVCESELRRHTPSLQAQVTQMRGREFSKTRRRLNPLFVEWLMGWPIGWSGSGSVATESFRLWRQRHSTLLRAALE